MKISKIKSLALLFISFFMFNFATTKAQCGYFFDNQTACPLKVNIDIYKPTGSQCNVICFSMTGVTVNPGISPINCGGCNVCDVQITVTAVGGVPATGTANTSNVYPNIAPITGGGCPTSGIVFSPSAPGGFFKILP